MTRIPTILLVDDMYTIRAFVKGILRPFGWKLLEAGDAKEALALCQRELPDVVVSDVNMPGMTGIELCQRLKTLPKCAGIPVVLLTGEKDAATREAGLAAGAAAYLKKPIDADELERTLKRLVDGIHPPPENTKR